MTYYMLFARSEPSEPFGPQFGDTSRSDVESEARDWVRSCKSEGLKATLKECTRIVRFNQCPSDGQVKVACAALED